MSLYPPIVENTIPAFTDTIKIQFKLNRAVGPDDFNAIDILIKDAYSNKELKVCSISSEDNKEEKDWTPLSNGIYELFYDIPSDTGPDPDNTLDNLLDAKKYYKFQIRLNKEPEKGIYSNEMIGKRIDTPTIELEKQDGFKFIGSYTNKDSSEKVFCYCFNLYEDGILIQTSGRKIHNNLLNDSLTESKDSWDINISFNEDKTYEIEYEVETVNGYIIRQREGLTYLEGGPPKLGAAKLKADFNSDESYNNVSLITFDSPNKKLKGNFLLYRTDSKSNFSKWEKLIDFKLDNYPLATGEKVLYKDYCIEQGVQYIYALQAYGKNNMENPPKIFYSSKLNTESKINSFEDCFLFDGQRQLKIRFNPKVNNFKSTILETKTDTIGGKHPFIFRNGNINYKEFQISGLLSLETDGNKEFLIEEQKNIEELRNITPENSLIENNFSSYLSSENFYKERNFKMEVLNWLTDGKPKLFKSAAEGNYIVRLLNVSLTPMEQLGRMLHTFNCTAYEIADYTIENLNKYNLLNKSNLAQYTEVSEKLIDSQEFVFPGLVIYAKLETFPGTNFHYNFFSDSDSREGTVDNSGIYIFSSNILQTNPLKSIELANGENSWPPETIISYCYLNDSNVPVETFVTNITYSDPSEKTVYGLGSFITEEPKTNNLLYQQEKSEDNNILEPIELITYGIYGRVSKKPIEEYKKETKLELGKIYYKIDLEGWKYFIPITDKELNNPIFDIIENPDELYSLQFLNNQNNFIQKDLISLELNKFEIIKNFKSLYLGKGLRASLYVRDKQITRDNSRQEVNVIYAL